MSRTCICIYINLTAARSVGETRYNRHRLLMENGTTKLNTLYLDFKPLNQLSDLKMENQELTAGPALGELSDTMRASGHSRPERYVQASS